jgi:hypothetical protein
LKGLFYIERRGCTMQGGAGQLAMWHVLNVELWWFFEGWCNQLHIGWPLLLGRGEWHELRLIFASATFIVQLSTHNILSYRSSKAVADLRQLISRVHRRKLWAT